MSNLLPEQRTVYITNQKITKDWFIVDAKGKTLGRLASKIAFRLQGKHRPDYAPHQNIGDYIVVVNAADIKVSGKHEKKAYYSHTLYPGGLKKENLSNKLENKPEQILELAVKRMLPKGPLGRVINKCLYVYPREEHKHVAQNLQKLELN